MKSIIVQVLRHIGNQLKGAQDSKPFVGTGPIKPGEVAVGIKREGGHLPVVRGDGDRVAGASPGAVFIITQGRSNWASKFMGKVRRPA